MKKTLFIMFLAGCAIVAATGSAAPDKKAQDYGYELKEHKYPQSLGNDRCYVLLSNGEARSVSCVH